MSNIERERRFLITATDIVVPHEVVRYYIEQGYVLKDSDGVLRIRSIATTDQNQKNWYLTIKKDTGIVGQHLEYEFQIHNREANDAELLFASLSETISKIRYCIKFHHLWIELDVFTGRHDGLVIAEVELESDEDDKFLSENLPSWFGEEITGRKEYSNYSLCKNGLPK